MSEAVSPNKKPVANGSRGNGTAALYRSAAGQSPADISAVAWIPRGELDHRQWAATGRRLGAIGRGSQWWIGDWLRYGAARWGEKYAEAARLTGYDIATLRNIAWVASQFEPSMRSEKLSWSHHVLLAPLEDDEKREWLDWAARESLSVSDLRTELRALRSGDAAASGADRGERRPAADRTDVVCPNCGHQLQLPTAH